MVQGAGGFGQFYFVLGEAMLHHLGGLSEMLLVAESFPEKFDPRAVILLRRLTAAAADFQVESLSSNEFLAAFEVATGPAPDQDRLAKSIDEYLKLFPAK